LFLSVDAGSLTSAALNQALVRATSPLPPSSERDTTSWTAADLVQWQRPPTAAPNAPSDESDARWIWGACLALLALETWMRSRQRLAAGGPGASVLAQEDRAA
jgi:hypothetical protein